MIYKIPLFDLNFDEAEEAAVLKVLRSKWISMGPKTTELERRFADEFGVKRAVADYVAGMTDRFAQDEYRKLFEPFERL